MNDKVLDHLHQVQIEILDEIVRICKLHHLTYYLAGGSVLGAVRHKGFIPWDDDVDVMMPRADYKQFLEFCKKELKADYYVDDLLTNGNYYLFFAKIKKKNTIFLENVTQHYDMRKVGIFVDIFPIDDAKKRDSLFQKMQNKAINIIRYELYCIRTGNKKGNGFKGKIKKIIFLPFSNKELLEFMQWLAQINNNKNFKYYVNLGSQYGYKKQTMLKSVYYPPKQLEFCGKLYNVPNQYDVFLKQLYGEKYMELPPEEKRITHNPIRLSFDGVHDEQLDGR